MLVDAPKILVVDREPETEQGLQLAFSSMGYRTLTAISLAQVIQLAPMEPDFIVLGLTRPDIEGSALVRELREIFSETPILAASRVNETHMKVAALDAGADDFMAKPFDMEELLARIRVGLRRRSVRSEQKTSLHIGELHLDVDKRALSVGDLAVSLSRKEFDLLYILARHAGKVLTHRYLVSQLWSKKVDIQYVRVYVSQIRGKIEANPAKPKYLLTQPGVGYMLCCD